MGASVSIAPSMLVSLLESCLCAGSVWKVHSGLAWSPPHKHMVGTRHVACFPRLENGDEAYRPSHPMALLAVVGRTESGQRLWCSVLK